MALTRRSTQRVSGSIWPGFVDAMTALLLVLMFVLTIFMIVQFVLRETISGQEDELDALNTEILSLSQALGLSQQASARLEDDLAATQAESDRQAALIANLSAEIDQQTAAIASFEEQVASLIAARDAALSEGAALAVSLEEAEAARETLLTEQEALNLALAQARDEIDAQTEAARLAAARRDALQALTENLRAQMVETNTSLADALAQLQETETREADALAALAALQGETDTLRDQLSVAESARILGLERIDEITAALAEAEAALSEEEAARLAELAAAEALRQQLEAAQEVTLALQASEADRLAELAAAEALRQRLANAENALTEEETARLAEAAAAEALREQLANADAELSALTLALEERRREAEETLTLLAAADAAEEELNQRLAAALLARQQAEDAQGSAEAALAELEAAADDIELQLALAILSQEAAESELASLVASGDEQTQQLALLTAERDALLAEVESLRGAEADTSLRDRLAEALAAQVAAEETVTTQLSEIERRDTLLATANSALAEEEAKSAESLREVALLNSQIETLRAELNQLQTNLDLADAEDAENQIRIQSLGTQLNAALARAADEQRQRAVLEAAEAERLREEAARLRTEAEELEEARSEFFAALRSVLGDREGIEIVGDRFVFSNEVLFQTGSATLSLEGQLQIERVAAILSDISADIPEGVDWIVRVDGHTDNVPISGGTFADNWELSQARALSVVRFLTDNLGFPARRLAATGFGEYRPVDPADTPEARARNRRIELKITER